MKPLSGWWVAGLLALSVLTGCVPTQVRSQSDDDTDKTKDHAVKTIGEITSVANAEVIPVSGVGLVVGLEGRGGPAPSGGYRTMLEDALRKRGIENVKEVLNSSDNAMVLVAGVIPAGARKGDRIDLQITLPENSKVHSLRGGHLVECTLVNYESTRNLSAQPSGRPDRVLGGHPLVKAEGPLLVGFQAGPRSDREAEEDPPTESTSEKVARIWGGGRVMIDRPFYLLIEDKYRSARVAMRVAERINEVFQHQGPGGQPIAVAKTKETVALCVPPQYRHNLSRFHRVVRMIPLDPLPRTGSIYRDQLREDLLDPAKTIPTALRLEALGSSSTPVLKAALASGFPVVRFAAAEALAYLGQSCCGDELARLAEEQPVLQAYCLSALASFDEAICHVKLRDLMTHSRPELRYGAFRALRSLDETDPVVRGEELNESFWLHRVAAESEGLVHVLSGQRAEIVLFGQVPTLIPPFALTAGPEFTVVAEKGDSCCTIGWFSTHGRDRRQCGFSVAEVLRTLAKMSGGYADAVELLREADRIGALSCPLKVDAFPEVPSVYDLAKLGQTDPTLRNPDAVLKVKQDLGAQPTLFEKPGE